jgi:GDPmannose 4,6-dehydratase
MKRKVALITGITGQDGSYLADFLLKKNYIVHGIKRRSSSLNTSRVDHIYVDRHYSLNFFLHYGDLTDAHSLTDIINKTKPNEIYNLAAQSHVLTSFKNPDYTTQVNAIGTLRILEAVRLLKMEKKIKFYQASTSELYGNSLKNKQSERTVFNPQSPYATSKLFSYWITKNYRDSYGMYAVNGILFNHESPRRGETFVTRKITIGLSRIALGLDKKLFLGNIHSRRDWGHASDYAEMQWKMLQQKNPEDFVIATGRNYSVKDFVHQCCKFLEIKIYWKGKSLNEAAYVQSFNPRISPGLKVNKKIIEIDKSYFRPHDVIFLKGDAAKARKKLGWKPKISFNQLVEDMMKEDYKNNKIASTKLINKI